MRKYFSEQRFSGCGTLVNEHVAGPEAGHALGSVRSSTSLHPTSTPFHTSSVLCVVPPVCQVNLCGACNNQLQLPGIKHRHQPHIHHLTNQTTHTNIGENTVQPIYLSITIYLSQSSHLHQTAGGRSFLCSDTSLWEKFPSVCLQ